MMIVNMLTHMLTDDNIALVPTLTWLCCHRVVTPPPINPWHGSQWS